MCNILITSVGKRVQLIKHLKKSFYIIGVDSATECAASHFIDKFYKVPKFNQPDYIKLIIKICEENQIKLIIPLHEKEFDEYLANIKKFNSAGIKVLLSDKAIIDICQNKLNTYKFFKANKIQTPLTYNKNELPKILNFPLILKPIDGMGSNNVYKLNNQEDLNFFINYVKTPILQEFKQGTEYTIDVLCDLNGNVISVVPRERLEVRAGEVSKSRTVNNDTLIYESLKVIECLNKYGKTVGPITIQCILNESGIYFIEINPRFGGGVPLTFESGVDYGNYILKMIDNIEIKNIIGKFEEITMIRYDEAVFIRS